MPPENPYAAPQVVELGPPVPVGRAEENQRPASREELTLLAREWNCARGDWCL
ncbi:MAG: hypothetical protein SFX18_07655 [Pirellulales bacterium]|nr:hypothetical protein [Pirellulales bacterium]